MPEQLPTLVLPPDKAEQLIQFLSGQRIGMLQEEVSHVVQSCVEERDFGKGITGAQNRRNFCKDGGMFVRRGVALSKHELQKFMVVNKQARIDRRNRSGQHIMFTGDLSQDPKEILNQSLIESSPLAPFENIGMVLVHGTQDTPDNRYLSEIWHQRIPERVAFQRVGSETHTKLFPTDKILQELVDENSVDRFVLEHILREEA